MDAPRILSKSTLEPITLAFARQHLKLVPEGSPATHADDELVEAYIVAAREYVESYTGLTLTAATLEQRLDGFPSAAVFLAGAPVRGIVSVTYLDTSGAEQTLDASYYKLNPVPTYPTFSLAYGKAWPSTLAEPGAVRIRYAAGYTTDAESPHDWPMPARLKHAVLLMLTHWYENRSSVEAVQMAEVPFSAVALMQLSKPRMGMA